MVRKLCQSHWIKDKLTYKIVMNVKNENDSSRGSVDSNVNTIQRVSNFMGEEKHSILLSLHVLIDVLALVHLL